MFNNFVEFIFFLKISIFINRINYNSIHHAGDIKNLPSDCKETMGNQVIRTSYGHLSIQLIKSNIKFN